MCSPQDAGAAAKAALGATTAGVFMKIEDQKFKDDRWANGRWVLSNFTGADGKVDWDAVSSLCSLAGCGTIMGRTCLCRRLPVCIGVRDTVRAVAC